MDTWDDLAEWWIAEVQDDPAYDEDVHPILIQLLKGTGGTTIDLGCGEGQGMRVVGGGVIGTDLSAPTGDTGRGAGQPTDILKFNCSIKIHKKVTLTPTGGIQSITAAFFSGLWNLCPLPLPFFIDH